MSTIPAQRLERTAMRRVLTTLPFLALLAALMVAPATPANAAVSYAASECLEVTPGNGHYGRLCAILDYDNATGSFRGHLRIYCYTKAGNEPCSRISYPGTDKEGPHLDLDRVRLSDGSRAKIGWKVLNPCLSWGTCPRDGYSAVTGWHTLGAGDCYYAIVGAQINIGSIPYARYPSTEHDALVCR